MKRYKTCNGCRALDEYTEVCQLGYEIDYVVLNGLTVGYKPLERCNKPKTIGEYVRLAKMRRG